MFKPRSSTPELRVQVMTLPDDYLVRRLHDHWAVVGPTGLFLVSRCESGSDGVTSTMECARRTGEAAHLLRTQLADVVPWVPFVDAVVVADTEGDQDGCTVIGIDQLEAVLTYGPRVIDEAGLQSLRHHLPGVVQAIEFESVGLGY